MSTFKPGAMLLHTAAVAIMTYAWFEIDNLPNTAWVVKQKGGHFQFLTIQGLVIAWLTMTLSLLADIAPSVQWIRNLKRVVFMISMPVAAAIATVYWSMVLFMPSLILRAPETGEWKSTSASEVPDLIRIPVKLDLALHAIPGTTLVLDFFLFERKYPKGQARLGGAAVALVAGLWYSCWAEYCASFNGIFPYPFLTFNPLPIRAAIYAGVTLFAYTVFQLLNGIHS